MNNDSNIRPCAWALIPFLVFAVFYVGLSVWANDFYKVPMTIAFLIASATALVFNRRMTLERKVDVYAAGMGETNIMMMCLIFILAGAFASVAKGSGAVDAAVTLAQSIVPARLMVAGVFLISCLISLAIGTSCGTIAAVSPIALGFAAPLQLSPALLLGAVVGGSMFGDNLSMISDTTIAATRTQGVRMKDKFLANSLVASPAALVALFAYAIVGASAGSVETPAVTWQHFVLVLPYVLILVLALVGLNVMLLLFAGTVLAAAIGVSLGRFDTFGALDLLGKGTLGMSETLIVAILAGGLFKTIQANGGILWLTEKIAKLVRGPRSCEFGMGVLVALVNCFTANNTVAIVIAGPIAKACSNRFKADPIRMASVLDTVSCIVQGVIPYGAQILIAIGIAKGAEAAVGSFDLISCLYYQPLLALAVLLSLVGMTAPGGAAASPAHGLDAVRAQVGVGLEEVPAAEEAAVGGERRGVGRFKDEMPGAVDDRALALGVGTPEHEDEVFAARGKRLHDGVREGFPAVSLVAAGVSGLHGERGVQEEDALVGPGREVAVPGEERRLVFVLQFLVHVEERGRDGDAGLHGEAEPVGLVGAVVGILPEDDDLDLVERRTVERLEDEATRWVDDALCVGRAHKARQFREIRAVELVLQHLPPRFVDFHVHGTPV